MAAPTSAAASAAAQPAAAPVVAAAPAQQVDHQQAPQLPHATVKHEEVDVKMKVVVVGCANVGKSSLLKRYLADEFDEAAAAPTIGVANARRDIVVDGEKLR